MEASRSFVVPRRAGVPNSLPAFTSTPDHPRPAQSIDAFVGQPPDDRPVVRIIPSTHPDVETGGDRNHNDIGVGDLVFTVVPHSKEGAPTYSGKLSRRGGTETALVGVACLNNLIANAAKAEIQAARTSTDASLNEFLRNPWKGNDDHTGLDALVDTNKLSPPWWMCPAVVARWAPVLGTVMGFSAPPASGRSGGVKQVDVQTSLRSTCKNGFHTASKGETSAAGWHAIAHDRLVVQYSLETLRINESDKNVYPIVMVSLVCVDAANIRSQYIPAGSEHDDAVAQAVSHLAQICDQRNQDENYTKSIDAQRTLDETARDKWERKVPVVLEYTMSGVRVNEQSIDVYNLMPLRKGRFARVTVDIGTVLHSPGISPNAYQAIAALYDMNTYHQLSNLEMMLGAP